LDSLFEKKRKKEKITALTAYDFPTAKVLEEAGVDIILAGDSYAMVKLGHETTLPVTMEEMLTITRAVSRAVADSILVADMPFLSFQVSEAEAVRNAGLFLKETKAQAVKIESTEHNLCLIEKIVRADIPVMGHIGLLPQSVYRMNGYRVQGRDALSAALLYELARNLERAGISCLVLEGMTAELAGRITADLRIPTIGIGAGPDCDGQVLVIDDLLGLSGAHTPKHARSYARLLPLIQQAVRSFKEDVEGMKFPDQGHYVSLEEKQEFLKKIKQ
jgi:3-methyl-2-oxobutanoate hydroxymethyltransferase